ncbi:MAG: hypothetical protein ACMXYD_00815 [Candidatus Woesearchaeota archaeon]
MKKRAQAAMEFLMTYGWAILVVLAAIGALAYFGVLSPDQFVNERCTIGSDFQCNNELVSTDEATLSVINTQARAVTIHSISLDGGCFDDVTVAIDETLTSRGESPVSTFACTGTQTNTAGTLQELDIRISYSRDGESINRTASGEFLARVQE